MSFSLRTIFKLYNHHPENSKTLKQYGILSLNIEIVILIFKEKIYDT